MENNHILCEYSYSPPLAIHEQLNPGFKLAYVLQQTLFGTAEIAVSGASGERGAMPASPVSSGSALSGFKNGWFCADPAERSCTALPIHLHSRLFCQTRLCHPSLSIS